MTLKGFGIALCVWIVWLFIILTVMGAGVGKVEQLGALIMAAAPTVLSVWLFNRLSPPKQR